MGFAGFGPKVEAAWIDEVLETTARYQTLELKEFVRFVYGYTAREQRHLEETFANFDRFQSGLVDITEFGIMLHAADVACMDTPIREISTRVRRQDARGFSIKEFKHAVELIHQDVGFSRQDVQRFGYAVQKCSPDGTGFFPDSLGLILSWIGHATSPQECEQLLRELHAAPTQKITADDFLVLMRTLRNQEMDRVEQLRDEFDEDDDGFLTTAGLQAILHGLGHFAEAEAIRDAAKDIQENITSRSRGVQRRASTIAYKINARKSRQQKGSLRRHSVGRGVAPEPPSPEKVKAVAGGRRASHSGLVAAGGARPSASRRRSLIRRSSTAPMPLGLPVDEGEEFAFGKLELWRFVEAYRARDGFSSAQLAEIEEAFGRYDRDEEGEISALEAGKVLRWLGYPIPYESQRTLVAEVDVAGTGRLDFADLKRLVRKVRERDVRLMGEAFHDYDVDRVGKISEQQAVAAVRSLGFADSEIIVGMVHGAEDQDGSDEPSLCSSGSEDDVKPRHTVKRGIDLREFLRRAMCVRDKARENYRKNAGYTREELRVLKSIFTHFDAGSRGSISNRDFRQVLTVAFPAISSSAKLRPYLLRVLEEVEADGASSIDFPDFLRTMRTIRDLHERDMIKKESTAVKETGFEPHEVEEFKVIFASAASAADGLERLSAELTFNAFAGMVGQICPLGIANRAKLQTLFEEVAQGSEADFSDYLRLMHRILKENFANLLEHTAGAAASQSMSTRASLIRFGRLRSSTVEHFP